MKSKLESETEAAKILRKGAYDLLDRLNDPTADVATLIAAQRQILNVAESCLRSSVSANGCGAVMPIHNG